MKKLKMIIKEEVSLKSIGIWFLMSLLGLLAFNLVFFKKNMDMMLVIEILSFAMVFVVMMASTKVYGRYIDGYYQAHIDKYERKSHRG